jgi:anti-sigma B factor antagonist
MSREQLSKGVPRVKVEQIGDVLVIRLPSRLDAAGLALIDSDFSEVATTHKGKLLADMSDVNFVASLALRMLLMNLKAVQPQGGDLRLAGLQPQIAEIFRKSRFDTLFKIYADRDAALASYAA